MSLVATSLLTLGVQAALLFAILVGISVATGSISIWLAIVLVVAFNIIVWLVSPYINDLVYSFMYDMEWISLDELREINPKAAAVIDQVCEENNYQKPELGLIKDGNPTAFTYGSDRWNARLFASEGLFEYLSDEESAAVYAHEMGHITHRDFIVMTMASTIVQLLYIAYSRSLRMANDSDGKSTNLLYGIAIASFIFYIISQYLLLYLSRTREYYADQFAGRVTDPNLLSTALVKIAYGIVDSSDDKELIEATKNLGIMNSRVSSDKGNMYGICASKQDWRELERSFIFDMKNPWAKLSELNSTHPLIGNRVAALNEQTREPVFNIRTYLERNPVDNGKMYRLFFQDLGVWALPYLVIIASIAGVLTLAGSTIIPAAGIGLVAVGLAFMARNYYKYNPSRTVGETTVLSLMSDVYASPMRGKHATLRGQFIGKGQAGYVLASNFQFRDRTGMLFTNYYHWLPGLGDLFFGWWYADNYVDKGAEVQGWFLRSSNSWMNLSGIRTQEESFSSYRLMRSLYGGAVIALVGVYFIVQFI